MGNLKGELVSVSTEDRVRLDGFFCEFDQASLTQFDSAILTHGLGGNFYSSRLLKALADQLFGLGLSVALVNTRGHDNLTTTVRMGQVATLGAGFEIVEECQFDLKAWADFLGRRGLKRQLLVGHSLGAIKSLFAYAHQPFENVRAIVALSATRLRHALLMDSEKGDDFRAMLAMAQNLVDQGKPDELMKVAFPFATWMAAGPYLEKYGPEDKYDWFQFAEKIGVPTLLVYGESELNDHPAFKAMRSDIAELRSAHSNFDFEEIEKADHFYSGRYQVTGEKVTDWIQSLG